MQGIEIKNKDGLNGYKTAIFKNIWVASTIATIIFFGALGAWLQVHHAETEKRDNMLQEVKLLAQTLNIDYLKILSGKKADTSLVEYQILKGQFNTYLRNNHKCSDLYLLGINNDGKVFFFLDNDEKTPALPGEVYKEASIKLRNVYSSSTSVIEGPITDKWGTWVSAMVPVKDPLSGKTLAVLCKDMDAYSWKRDVYKAAIEPLLMTLCILVILFISIGLYNRRLKLRGTVQHSIWHIEPILAAMIGLTLTLFVSHIAYYRISFDQSRSFKALAISKTANFAVKIFNLKDIELEGLANYYIGSEDVSLDEFQKYTQFLLKSQFVQNWGWIQVVPYADTASFRKYVNKHELKSFRIWQKNSGSLPLTNSGRNVYYPLLQITPLKGNEHRLGYDFGSDSSYLKAMELAARTGLMTSSDLVNPESETDIQKEILMIFRPVYYNSEPKQLRGFAVAELNMASYIENVDPDNTTSLEIFLLHNDSPPDLITKSNNPIITQEAELTESRPLFAFGKVFAVNVQSGPEFNKVQPIEASLLTALMGILLTAALALLTGMTLRRHEKLEQLVTERTSALQESETNFRLFFENSPVGKSITEIDGSLKVNKTFCNIVGYTEEELKTKKWNEITYPEDIAGKQEIVKSMLDGIIKGKRFETRFVHKNGSIIWTDFSTLLQRDLLGNPQFFITSINDITERKKAEEALEESRQLFQNITTISPVGIFRTRVDGYTTFVNPRWSKLSGLSFNEALGFGWLNAVHPDDRHRLNSNWNNDVNLHRESIAEYRFVKPDGSVIWVLGNAIPEIKDKKITGFIGTLTDITDRKLAEKEIRNMNEVLEHKVHERTKQLEAANKETEAFNYSISHDLRSPLRAIDGFANFLLQDYSTILDAEGNRLLNVIIQNANKMGFLIDDLLAFSRLGRQEIQKLPIDMRSMAQSVYEEITTNINPGNIEFCLPNIPETFGDPAMVRQIWVNLIGNAIKYTSKKPIQKIEIGYSCVDGENIYSVTDNGAGFDMAYYNKLFGVFQRLHTVKEFEGTGIGLAIVKLIVARHKGRVWAEGTVGIGAAFYFSLPGV